MKTTIAAGVAGGLNESEVVDFLRSTPDFFDRHPDLLGSLRIHHDGQGAVSLVEYQLRLLRQKNERLEQKLLTLLDTARENEALSLRMHRLALALIETESVEDVVATAVDQLRNEFKTETVNIVRFVDVAEDGPTFEKMDRAFPNLFSGRRPYSGGLSERQASLLFGDEEYSVRSAAVAPLFGTEPLGFLALGSRDQDRFSPGLGVLFLRYLGELVGVALSHQQRLARG